MPRPSTYLQKTREEMLADTQYVVEATGTESLMLWERYCVDSIQKSDMNRYEWEQINPGYMVTVGEFVQFPFTRFPVNISIHWFRICGVLVMFYECISRVVDHDMVKAWLAANCNPKNRYGQSNHADAMNFHNVMHYVRELENAKHDAAAIKLTELGAKYTRDLY